MNNKPDSKVEVKACEHKMCTVLGSGHKWCTECGAFKTFPDEAYWRMPSKPIANNGVSCDWIKTEEHIHALISINDDSISAAKQVCDYLKAKLQPTAPRGGNMVDVVKKAVESGLILVKPCEGCGSNGWYVGHRLECSLNREECCDCGGEQIQCEPCSGNGFTITEGEVSGG